MVRILDVLVPQKGKELADILKLVDRQTPVEQVIAVPKISNFLYPAAFGSASSADGRTVGGSADGVVLCLASAADRGADR